MGSLPFVCPLPTESIDYEAVQFCAFHVMPTFEAFGTMLEYLVDHAVKTGSSKSGSVSMSLQRTWSALLKSLISAAGVAAVAPAFMSWSTWGLE